jgi:hypothetical protein
VFVDSTPSLIFAVKFGAYPSGALTVVHSKLSIHAHKYRTRVEVAGSDKRSSLLRYEINYGYKKFCSAGPWLQ